MLLILSTLLATIASEAQTPLMVQDIFPGTVDARPNGLVGWNGKLYFSARDSAYGQELRSYDEVSPVKLIKDLIRVAWVHLMLEGQALNPSFSTENFISGVRMQAATRYFLTMG
jgi:hypothetical protein